jgi:MATE family multidrug resistance protein
MSMGVVDTIMVGPLGPAAIGVSGMSNSLFFAVAVFGMGVMLGLDALVAKSYGAGRLDDCVRWLQHGVLVALIVAPTIMPIFYGARPRARIGAFTPQCARRRCPIWRFSDWARRRCCPMQHVGDTCRECTPSGP